eukprot:21576-Heterocapsa_arctica.AAC.1
MARRLALDHNEHVLGLSDLGEEFQTLATVVRGHVLVACQCHTRWHQQCVSWLETQLQLEEHGMD